MAKQSGPNFIEGCFCNVVFYRMGKEYYARSKSSLNRKRVKRDPAFKETMKWAGLLGEASRIASAIYKKMTGEKEKKITYRKLVGKVMQLLKKKKTSEEINRELLVAIKISNAARVKQATLQKRISYGNEIIHYVFSRQYAEADNRLAAAPG